MFHCCFTAIFSGWHCTIFALNIFEDLNISLDLVKVCHQAVEVAAEVGSVSFIVEGDAHLHHLLLTLGMFHIICLSSANGGEKCCCSSERQNQVSIQWCFIHIWETFSGILNKLQYWHCINSIYCRAVARSLFIVLVFYIPGIHKNMLSHLIWLSFWKYNI